MKKVLLLVFLSTLLSLTAVLGVPTLVAASSVEIVVPDNYERIEDAINNANDGDTIFVRAGTYHEHLVIRKTLYFEGENCDTTVIDGDGSGWIFYLAAFSRVRISGFRIQNASYGVFMYHTYSYSHVIRSNTLTHLGTAIALAGPLAANNEISGNIISHNELGLFLSGCKKNTFSGNIIENNTIGIRLNGSPDHVCEQNVISGNTIRNNAQGIHLSGYTSGNTIYANNFVDNTFQTDSTLGNQSFNNKWDNSRRGNYWSDYEKKYPDAREIDELGIWDTPYVIDENNQDNHPLMNFAPSLGEENPFWDLWWLWAVVAVLVVAVAGTIYFLKKGKRSTD